MERLRPQNLQPDSEPEEPPAASVSASQISPDDDAWILPIQQAQPGDKIGKYEVIHEIGRGGMSIVYKARDQDLNRLVAVKLMLKSSHESLNLLRFQKEARAASQLEHPNIVKVHDFSTTDDGTPYLVMSYLDGISLADAIKNEGSFSLARWLSVMIQACDALEHAHLAGVVHRDIKPSNFVLAQENGSEVLKLVDFGIATNSFDDMSLTKTGEIFGSPLYMSPEQCSGAKLDSRSDIYSLGCVMYEALAGKPPLSGSNSLSTLQKHLTDKPASLTKLKLKTKNIQQLDRIVMRCLEKSPENRYQNLGDLKKELELLCQGQSVDSINPSAITIPVVMACVFACLTFFITFLNFDKITNRMPFSALIPHHVEKATSSGVPRGSHSLAEKRIEFDKREIQYETLMDHHNFPAALKEANRLASLAVELNFPAFNRGENYFRVADCEIRLRRLADAAEHYDAARLLMVEPKTPAEHEAKYLALMHYGTNLRGTGADIRAKEVYREAMDAAVQQQNKKHQALSLKCMGECDKDLKQYADCLVLWRQALKLDPSDARNRQCIKELEQVTK